MGGLWQGYYMTNHHRKESPGLPHLKLSGWRWDLKIGSQPQLLWASYCRATTWWWTAIGSECCCMFVWVMGGLWQGCYMTIHHRKESPGLPHMKLSGWGWDLKIRSQPQLLWASYCHATTWWWIVIGFECCCMFVWVMGGLWQGCYMTIHHRKESLATHETLSLGWDL